MLDVALLREIIVGVARSVSALGLLVIVWGIVLVIKDFLLEFLNDSPKSKVQLRQRLGAYLILGLEFIVAANIIKLVSQPDWNAVAMLAAIIGLRIVLSFFLGLELKETNGNGNGKKK